ncbi:MAG: ABC transporter substrate-binding protein, partial [Thermodesulfobacteriota bacterium]|nr:ABC transporter substrate-binding protein [Thermodesulfobacteriota bacterium]
DYIVHDLKEKAPKICLAYVDAESGKVVRDHAKEWAEFYGLKLRLEVLPMGGLEAVSQVVSMKKAGITHTIIHHTSQGVILLLREQSKFGLSIPVFGTSPTCAEETVRIGGKASRNYIGAHLYSSWYDETPGMANLRKITIGYHPGTEKPPRSKQYTGGWVAATILYEGMKRAGTNLNAETLVDSIETIRDFDTKGLCGPITYTTNNHRGLYHCKLFKANPETGRFIPITDWRRPPFRD